MVLGLYHFTFCHTSSLQKPSSRCSIKYLTVPNSSHLHHCACAISQSLMRCWLRYA